MALLTITTFVAFANLVVAGCRLGTAGNPVDALKSLADIATGAKSLDAALGTTGLAAVAAEMARTAEDHARHFTHPGHARDDAIALFWQVAPSAFADPATFAAAHLDPALTADRMVDAIRAGPHARDFAATPLAEPFFRGVAIATLKVMLARADTVAALAPALWRQSLENDTALIETTARTESKLDRQSDQLARMEQMLLGLGGATKGVPEAAVLELARRIEPHVSSTDEAMAALRRAIDLAADSIARGEAGSNVDAFVDATLRRLAALTAEGRLDTAAEAADAAVAEAEAGLTQILDAAIRQHLLAFDAEAAARQIVRKLTLETPDPSDLFGALRREQDVWYERGRDRGLRLDLEVSIALAGDCVRLARGPDETGTALNDLGTALATLGGRESRTDRLEQAVEAYRAGLEEWTRERVPLDWATTQMNLGNALLSLGARERGTDRLEQAVAAYRAALEERTRDRVPLDWAQTQMNLGNALLSLGERKSGTDRLEQAVAAYRAALEERTRERVPLGWAATQMNLGNALATLGERESGTDRLEQAVAAYRAALEEWTRERVPLDWAATQMNLGTALSALGARESGTVRLEQAVAAYRAALEEWTRERAPLDWAATQMNLGTALGRLGARESCTDRLEQAVAAFSAALEVRTRERVPLDWANTTWNEGVTIRMLAERTFDFGMARQALAQLEEAELVLQTGGHTPLADYYARQIREAEALVARLSQ